MDVSDVSILRIWLFSLYILGDSPKTLFVYFPKKDMFSKFNSNAISLILLLV